MLNNFRSLRGSALRKISRHLLALLHAVEGWILSLFTPWFPDLLEIWASPLLILAMIFCRINLAAAFGPAVRAAPSLQAAEGLRCFPFRSSISAPNAASCHVLWDLGQPSLQKRHADECQGEKVAGIPSLVPLPTPSYR